MVAETIQSVVLRLASAGVTTGALALRPAAALQRQTADGVGRATLALIDRALASPYADEAIQRVLESGLAERAVARALSGDLVDAVARDLVRYEVIERVTDRVLEGNALDHALDRVDIAGVPQQVAERLLADGIVERLAERLVAGPELERIVDVALDSEGVERIVARVVESRVVRDAIAHVADDAAERLRDSDAMWALVDEIAQSPAVSEAMTQQGAGFADQVGDELRDRSRNVDARLEHAAWRLLRRRPRPTPGTT